MNKNTMDEFARWDEDEARMRGCYWLRVALVMLLAIALACAMQRLYAEEAKPTMSTKNERGDMVRLTLEPCPEAPPWLGLHKAQMLYGGIEFEACWIPIGQTILVFDSGEDLTPIPLSAFEQDQPI